MTTYEWEVHTRQRMLAVVEYCWKNKVEFRFDPFPDWPAGEHPVIIVPEENSEAVRKLLKLNPGGEPHGK